MNIIYGMNICSLNFFESEIAFIIESLCLQSTNASYKSIDLKKKKNHIIIINILAFVNWSCYLTIRFDFIQAKKNVRC